MDRIQIFFIILLFLIYSCSENDGQAFMIGDEFIDSETSVAMIDTYSVRMSTVLIDSVITSGKGVAMVGRYDDEYLGTVTSKSYFELGIPDNIVIDEKQRFDSITLQMNYLGIYIGDTLKSQVLNVYRLKEDLELNEDDDNLYNTSSFDYYPYPIGSITYKPKPNSDEALEIRLSDDLGLQLFEMMKENSDTIKTESKFIDYFLKGLVIGPGDEEGSVISFDTKDSLITMVLYTSLLGEEKEEIDYKFQLTNSEKQYNQITCDRTGTGLEPLVTKRKELGSDISGNKSFMQNGAGLMTRLEFPGLSSLLEMSNDYILVRAELLLKPVPFSYKKIPLPESLVVFNSNMYNNLTSEITNTDGTTLPATLKIDEIYNEDTYYVFDITDYVEGEISDAIFDVNHGLIVGLSGADDGASTLERVVFDGRDNSAFKPELRLYFIFYN